MARRTSSYRYVDVTEDREPKKLMVSVDAEKDDTRLAFSLDNVMSRLRDASSNRCVIHRCRADNMKNNQIIICIVPSGGEVPTPIPSRSSGCVRATRPRTNNQHSNIPLTNPRCAPTGNSADLLRTGQGERAAKQLHEEPNREIEHGWHFEEEREKKIGNITISRAVEKQK